MSIAIALDDLDSDSELGHESASNERASSAPRAARQEVDNVRALRRTVLLVEDNTPLRETLSQILSSEGYAIIEAEDGLKALEVLESSAVDVVILDLAMPRMNGMELLSRMDAPPPVVIVYSAFEYYAQEEFGRQSPSKVFRALKKPAPPAELISCVAEAVTELENLGR